MERKRSNEPFPARLVAHRLRLARNELVGLRDALGAVVAVSAGSVWITQERDGRDVVLAAGECCRLDRPGTAIVQALGAATVSVTAPTDRPLPALVRAAAGPKAEPRRGHVLARSLWAAWLRLFRRHARPRPWELCMTPASSSSVRVHLAGPAAQELQAVARDLAALAGVVDVRPGLKLPRVLLVEYDPLAVGARALAAQIRRRCAAAAIVGA